MSEFESIGKITLFGRDNISVFANRPHSLNEVFRNTVQKYGEKTALILENETLTYKELDEKATRVAATLQKKYGVVKGDRLFSFVGNSLEFPILIIACAKLGAVVIPANTKLTMSEISYIIGHSKPKLLLVEDELLHVINECREQFSEVNVYTNTIITVGNSLSEHSFTSLLNGYSEVNEAKVDETDPAYILYTSGTTGRPKGAILSHVNIIHSLIHYKTGLQTTDEMRTMIAVPLFHVTGLIAQLLHMVFIGGSAVILKKYNNEKYIKQSFETKVNFHFNVPTIFIMMSTSPLIKNYPFDFVRLVAFGGSPIYLQTLQKLKELFPNANFHNVYGATETASPTTMMPTEYPMTKATSVGLPVKNAQIKIVDSTGKELGANEVGEILIKGPMVIGGYLDNDEANQTTFVDGYWKSGDIAKIDEDGFVYILDRIKDMINRGGEKIFSIEVEDVLKSHPEVIEAAIISIPDEIYGEKVKAIIVSDTLNESTIPQIKEYCLQKLAKYKVPEVFEFVKELPKTASGKILKHVLKQR